METGFYEQISAPLTKMEEGLSIILQSGEPFVQEINAYLLNAPGKRIRPALFFLTLGLWSGKFEKHIPVAIAIELIHTASLVHDDVVDDAQKRRGLPTINNVWGNHVSVLMGDYLFARAFALLTEYGSLALIREMSTLVEKMAEGEMQQQAERFNPEIGQEDYLCRIAKKTAHFFVAAARAGGIVTQAEEKEIQLLADYGYNMGMAFQLTDDLLDICGDSQTTGKPAAADLQQGIITLPVLHVLKNSPQGETLSAQISIGRVNQQVIAKICREMANCGTVGFVRNLAAGYVDKARQALAGLPQNACHDTLYMVSQFVLERKW
ncbi:MAG: polyprenyl synthetase family protein [Bacillota bacterium]|nr:polyprenyl synthetase family protein [Bacillota bacterium]MDW7683979.1 polyprenyl synthetase family protein [Bacillota bacterium]